VIKDFQNELIKINDDDFIILLLTPFIPDTYRTNWTKEKLFTKLVEVLFSDWCRRIWFNSDILTQKSNKEDVRFFINKKAILTDSKTFRLWRSQKAPNHKDFLKLESVKHWIENHNKEEDTNAIWWLIAYPNQHEWVWKSEVYKMCSDKNTPTLMLPYTYLSLLLDLKSSFNIDDIIKLWNYDIFFEHTVNNRIDYWKIIDKELLQLLDIDIKLFNAKKIAYKWIIDEFIIHSVNSLKIEKGNIIENISNEIKNKENIKELKKELIDYKIQTETNQIDKILVNIEKFRVD